MAAGIGKEFVQISNDIIHVGLSVPYQFWQCHLQDMPFGESLWM